ncbi:MAG: MoxR family ATPase [Bdellovibrionia bacterium]
MGNPAIPLSNSTPLSSVQVDKALDEAGRIFLGKNRELRLALTCLLAGGHLLIEDIPGVGKTTLIKLLAKILNLPLSRVQFTNDLLPADILGTSVFDAKAGSFDFHRGPIFTTFLLADELNRATPKTQSALLQAMEERHVTIDGRTYPLPRPFFVVATQNPVEQVGTFALPESQLDRFLMRIEIGYPDRDSERDLLLGEERSHLLDTVKSDWTPANLIEMQEAVARVHISKPIADYLLDILAKSREKKGSGLSPRAGLGMARAAKCWAYLQGRDRVIPEDVQATAPYVINHRLWWLFDRLNERSPILAARDLVLSVPVR